MCPAGRSDAEGVKALAIAAQRCFADYRPGGMRVIAGSVILEPGLQRRRFQGARARKASTREGGLWRREDGLRLCAARRRRQGRRPDHHLPHRRLVDPRLWRHHRRSSARDAPSCIVSHQWRSHRHAGRRFRTRDPRKRHGPAGLHRRQSPHDACCARGLPMQHDAFDRFIIATDTPTGSGIMPLGDALYHRASARA